MATLLDGVNEVLKRVRIIAGDSAELASLTDGARQSAVDVAVQSWNEAIDELYSAVSTPKPDQLGEATITLVTGDRDYALDSTLNRIFYPLLNETDGHQIFEWTGGYLDLVRRQFQPADFTGEALFAVIRPTDGELYLDRIPTAAENGDVYKYRYDKELKLTAAADVMPFKEVVFRGMVPVVAEIWKRSFRGEFDEGLFNISLGRASRFLIQKPQRSHW